MKAGNSGTFLSFDLPNSKIHVRIPLIYYQNAVKEPHQKGRGTIPDYPIQRSMGGCHEWDGSGAGVCERFNQKRQLIGFYLKTSENAISISNAWSLINP